MSKLSALIKLRFEWFEEDDFLEIESPDGLVVIFTGEISSPEVDRSKFEEVVRQAASFLGKKILEISLIGSKVYINDMAIGDYIKVHSPVSFSKIITGMSDEFSGKESDYKRILDGLRRVKRVVRSVEGNYSLTYKGIIETGTRKNRNSPDVRRLLATWRKGS